MLNAAETFLRPLCFGLVMACSSANAPVADTLTLEIAPQRRPCVGEAVQQCLVVRLSSDSAWKNFFDPIEGFTHEAGYRYRVQVERSTVAKPPADGSRYHYRLVRIVSREREERGASGG